MRIIRTKDYEEMSRKAASIISAQVLVKPDCVLGLATGGTPVGTYKNIVEWYNNGDLDFSEVKSVNLDEYRGLPRDAFDLGTHCVQLTEETIDANQRFFDSRDEVPREAYTMGTRTIMHARKVLMVVSGKDKAEIIKKAFFGPVTPQVPASILQMHPDFTLVADEDALSLV